MTVITKEYSWRACLAASERINWKIEDVIGDDRRLDFARPFMPEALAGVSGLDFLTPGEKLALNQIRGNGYLYMFGLVEEFILPFVLDHARPQLHGDDWRVRALLQFASEEAKHIQLFHRFREAFEDGFGSSCDVIGPPDAIAKTILAHHPLSIALVTLHIEWMTQRHYQESARDDTGLDPQFKNLLRYHWMEECQHAKLDTLIVEALAEACTPEERMRAVEGYLQIGAFIDGGLAAQVKMDAESLTRATGRVLTDAEMEVFTAAQMKAQRWTFLGSGMTHPNVIASLDHIGEGARRMVAEVAPAFC